MGKVVYNACYGGFGLSLEATKLLAEKKGLTLEIQEPYAGITLCKIGDSYFSVDDYERHDPDLVAVVEELGSRANGMCAKLVVEEVSGLYRIDEYDGYESIEVPDDINWTHV